MAKNIAELEKYLSNPNVQAFLALLRDTEGTSKGADPYRVFGGSAKNQLMDLSTTPSFSKWGFNQTDGKKNSSSATGAYQFLKKTWQGLQDKYGFTDFSPKSQDLGAIALLIQNGSMPALLKGDFNTAVKKSNTTWASLPGSPYAQHTRSNQYVQNSLSKHLGSPVDFAKYEVANGVGGVYGDSIAVGVRDNLGLPGDAVVGRSPAQVLSTLEKAIKSGELQRGTQIILSTGLSNNPSDKASVAAQMKLLKENGISFRVLGVYDGFKGGQGKELNNELASLVSANGGSFMGGFNKSNDGVHPASYAALTQGLVADPKMIALAKAQKQRVPTQTNKQAEVAKAQNPQPATQVVEQNTQEVTQAMQVETTQVRQETSPMSKPRVSLWQKIKNLFSRQA